MTTPEVNQCDGCASGFALDGAMHRLGDGKPYMICQAPKYTQPTPEPVAQAEDSLRLDHLQNTGSTIEILPGGDKGASWRFRVGGLHPAVSSDIRAAIDAARGVQPAAPSPVALQGRDELPPLPQGWPARFRCDSCDGNGEIGEPIHMGHFQPPERERCPDCNGRGWSDEEDAFNAGHMRDYAQAARASLPAGGVVEPWGWAIVDKHGTAQAIRPRIKEFFGSIQDQQAFTREDVKKMDSEWPGLVPHCLVTLYATPQPSETLDADSSVGEG